MLGRPSVGASPTDAPGLPQVLHNAPAAVLVIDLDRSKLFTPDRAAGERVALSTSTRGRAEATNPAALLVIDLDRQHGPLPIVPPRGGVVCRSLTAAIECRHTLTPDPFQAGRAGRDEPAV